MIYVVYYDNTMLARVPRVSVFSLAYHNSNEVEQQRNRQGYTSSWQFTTADAREKLHQLYPDVTTKEY